MRIIRAENYRRMRWKNGGGETAEIAVFPEGAGLDGFGWRISMAKVEAGGPFSAFPEVDRTLSILEGEGIVLDIEGRQPVTLTSASAPYRFAADAATNAELLGGPVTDLNVMTRRGRYQHKVSVREIDGSAEISLEAEQALLFCRTGSMAISDEGGSKKLGRFDATIVDCGVALRIEGRAQFFVVELNKLV